MCPRQSTGTVSLAGSFLGVQYNIIFLFYNRLSAGRDELTRRSRVIRTIRAVIRSIRVSQSEEAHHAGVRLGTIDKHHEVG